MHGLHTDIVGLGLGLRGSLGNIRGVYELASILLVCGNGGFHVGCPVSFCSGFSISTPIEQPPLLLDNRQRFMVEGSGLRCFGFQG